MIEVTKLNKATMILNADLIECVEKTPDTIITLTTGRKVMVRETLNDIIERVLDYRGRTRAYPVPAVSAHRNQTD